MFYTGDSPLTAATSYSAGADLHCPTGISMHPGTIYTIDTGISIQLEPNMVAFVVPRSSLGLAGLFLANTVGVIDADYRGTIRLMAAVREPMSIKAGDRIAQLVTVPVIIPRWTKTDKLTSTERGAGGFGSTGR